MTTPSESPAPRKRRVRVTARALLYHQGHVLLLKGHEGDGKHWYVLPGGGVEHGESLADAVVREMREETDITVVAEDLLFVREFIPERHPGRSKFMPATNHVIALIYRCRPCEKTYPGMTPQEIGTFPGDADGTGAIIDMEWISLDQVEGLDLRPPHLLDGLREAVIHDDQIRYWPEDAAPLAAKAPENA